MGSTGVGIFVRLSPVKLSKIRSSNVRGLAGSLSVQSSPKFAFFAAAAIAASKPPISSTNPNCLACAPDQTRP